MDYEFPLTLSEFPGFCKDDNLPFIHGKLIFYRCKIPNLMIKVEKSSDGHYFSIISDGATAILLASSHGESFNIAIRRLKILFEDECTMWKKILSAI